MKFYDCKTAPSPRRVRLLIAEKGLDIETIAVDLASGEQFGEAFRRLNPDCTVPVLALDDGTCLTEALGICRYLEAVYPEPPLFGRTPAEQGVVMSWNAKIEQQGLMAMGEAFRNSVSAFKGRALPGPGHYEQIPELAARGRERVAAFMATLDARLTDSEFVAGADYSLADITALVFVDFAKRGKLGPSDQATALARWYAAVSARPSAVA